MLITTAHLFALHELVDGEAAGHTVRMLAEVDLQEHTHRELELQGLVLLEVPRAYRLTYTGREALGLLEAMREAALLPLLDHLKHDWRFLGSDILAALQMEGAHSARAVGRSGASDGPGTARVQGNRPCRTHGTLYRRGAYHRGWDGPAGGPDTTQ